MPRDDRRDELGDHGGLGGGEIIFLSGVGVQIVELGRRTFVSAEKFPTAVAHREVGEIVVAGERGSVGWTPEKEWSVAGGFGVAEKRVAHVNAVEGGVWRSGNTGERQ